MDDQRQGSNSPSHSSASERNEPVRSRWTPKPEQILILESIFNSGMVNPPKDETVRIRKLLEKFGPVGDANVFYWFQNRRSRSRRRQRQMQAANLEQRNQFMDHQAGCATVPYESSSSNISVSMSLGASSLCFNNSPSSRRLNGSPSTCGVVDNQEACVDSYFPVSCQLSFQESEHNSAATSVSYHPDASNLQYQSGLITVFINGIPMEVHRGKLDARTLFGEDVVLVHSSGVPVPTDDFGLLLQGLQHGESYFVVSSTSTHS